MALGQNIRKARTAQKLSQETLSTMTGGLVSQGAISALEKRDSSASEFAPALAEALGVSLHELLTGECENKTAPNRSAISERISINDVVINQHHDAHGSMGGGLLLRDQPGQITGWRVTSEWANKNIPSNTGKDNLCIVTGFGDSMRGMFNSGDPLLVDTGVRDLQFDGVYFFRIGTEGFIKRLQRIPGDGVRVISKNTDYETWTITPDMEFEIFGRVVKVWKSEDL